MASVVMLAFFASSVAVISGATVAEQLQGGKGDGDDVAKLRTEFIFSNPDLYATMATSDDGELVLEAFKSVHNDERLATLREGRQQSDSANDANKLLWVSTGHPTFVATPDPSAPTETRLFHFTPSGFHTYVQMLTAEQRHLLATTANSKYRGINVSDEQVANLILSQFSCALNYDGVDADYDSHVISGLVGDFSSYPLRIDFQAPLGSVQRSLAAELMGDDKRANLQFTCHMASRDTVSKSITLTIDAQRSEDIGIIDALFRPQPETAFVASSDAVYVTRGQLVDLASRMYWTLSIEEEFRMTEDRFVEAFVADLVNLTSVNDFAMVTVDDIAAADELSFYGFDDASDFRTDRALDELGRILRVGGPAEVNAKRRIVVDEPKYDDLQHSGRVDGVADLLGVKASVTWARANAARASTDLSATIEDQLKELNNNATQNDIEWSFDVNDTDRVVPRALRVTRLERTRFLRKLTFGRVHLQTTEAAFEQQFSMYTTRAVGFPSAIDSPPTLPASPKQATDAAGSR
jgi:hypothetical protein